MIFNLLNPVYTLPLKNTAAVPELTAIGSERQNHAVSHFDLTACSVWGNIIKKASAKRLFILTPNFLPQGHFPRKSRMS